VLRALWTPHSETPAQGRKPAQADAAAPVDGAPPMRMQLQFVEARSPDEFPRACSNMSSARGGALTVLPNNRFLREHKRLVDLAAKNRLPAVYTSREFVDAGGLMAYAVEFRELYERAPIFIDKIFKGAPPAELPIELPTRIGLWVNLKTARTLGLKIPQSVLLRAVKTIE